MDFKHKTMTKEKELLVKYIAHILDYEGTDFLNYASIVLSKKEIEELSVISLESKALLNHDY